MTEKLSDKKKINAIVFLFSMTYMVSYITRTNFGAIISEMESATEFSRSLISMAITGSFITYGVGQIVSGIIGDFFSPKKLLSIGLLVSVLMNFLIPFCNSPYLMALVWSVNGFAQSFMWPPLITLMTYLLNEEDYKKNVVKISWGSSFGTIAIYLISPLLIMLLSWKAVFFFASVCGIIMLFFWNKYSYDIDRKPMDKTQEKEQTGSKTGFFSAVLAVVMIVIVLQGTLRDGVQTWMPSYISDEYNLGNEISILSGVILPIFTILVYNITSKLYRTKLKNPLLCAGIIFGIGAIAAVGLYLFTGKSAFVSVLMCAVLTGCMHGVNLMLVSMLPAFFGKTGKVSSVTGLLNSCTYIGSAISTYGVAVLSERFDWGITLIVWCAIAIVGTLVCFLCVKPWKNRYNV